MNSRVSRFCGSSVNVPVLGLCGSIGDQFRRGSLRLVAWNSVSHRRCPPAFDIQVNGLLHSPKIAIRCDDGQSMTTRSRSNPDVVFPEAKSFDVDAAQLRLFTGTKPGNQCSLQFPVHIGRLFVDRKDLDIVKEIGNGFPVIGRVRRLFGHIYKLTADHNARGNKNVAKRFQFSGDAGVPGKKFAAMVGVEEVHALKRGFASNGANFL